MAKPKPTPTPTPTPDANASAGTTDESKTTEASSEALASELAEARALLEEAATRETAANLRASESEDRAVAAVLRAEKAEDAAEAAIAGAIDDDGVSDLVADRKRRAAEAVEAPPIELARKVMSEVTGSVQVTNRVQSIRTLCAQGEIPEGKLPSPAYLDREYFDPGETKAIDARFLQTEGALQMLVDGDLEVERV